LNTEPTEDLRALRVEPLPATEVTEKRPNALVHRTHRKRRDVRATHEPTLSDEESRSVQIPEHDSSRSLPRAGKQIPRRVYPEHRARFLALLGMTRCSGLRMTRCLEICSATGRRCGIEAQPCDFSGRSRGNRITSRMEWELVKSITRRSMPTPSPPVGGMP